MPLELTVVTPEGEAYSGSVEQVVLPGAEGDFGVLPGHERYLAALREGTLEIRGARAQSGQVSEGFAEVSGDRVTVLVDSCSFSEPG